MLLFSDYIKNFNNSNLVVIDRDIKRKDISGFYTFKVGDIIIVFFWVNGIFYRFEGICICLKKKKFKKIDVILILRNVLGGVGIELSISYFHNRLFSFKFSDFKRKKFIYKRSKLYYLRYKLNRESRILL